MSNDAMIDYLLGQLSETERFDFEQQMAANAALQQEMSELKEVWETLRNAEKTPDKALDKAFYESLEQEKSSFKKPIIVINSRVDWQSYVPIAINSVNNWGSRQCQLIIKTNRKLLLIMKKTLYLLIFVTALGCSDQKEKNNIEAINSTMNRSGGVGNWNSKTFAGVIGIVNRADESMSFKVEQKTLIASFNTFLKAKSNIDAKLKSVSLVKINDNYYLRGFGDEYKSTMLLNKGSGGVLSSAGVTCTTSACSHTSGCEPQINGTCSACSGDCTKSTNME